MKRELSKIGMVFGFVLMSLLQIGIYSATAQVQEISVLPSTLNQKIGDEFELSLQYNADHKNLTGLGLNLHFDSKNFEYMGYTEFLTKGDMYSAPKLMPDTSDEDKNQATDMMVNISWASVSSHWPGADLPVILAKVSFKVKAEAEKGDSPMNISAFEHDADYSLVLSKALVTATSHII